MSEQPSQVESIVKKYFTVKDQFALEGGSVEYRVLYDQSSKMNFVLLHREATGIGYSASLSGTRDDATLLMENHPMERKISAKSSFILLFLTLLSISAAAWFEYIRFGSVVTGQSLIWIAAAYVAAIIALIGFDVLAHRFAAQRTGNKSPSFYPIPGIPVVFFSAVFGALIIPLPTFGTVIVPRERLINKDSVFSISLAGPIVGVLVVLLVSFVGAVTSVNIPTPPSTLGSISYSILQRLVETISGASGLNGQIPYGYVRIASPLAVAGWVGFFIIFLNLLPAGLLDGGYMSWSVLGPRGTRIAFLLTIVLLLLIDVPSYWFVAILILITAGGSARIETLDSISEVSPRKKFLFLAAVIIALLCLPIPQTIATLPLGLGQ